MNPAKTPIKTIGATRLLTAAEFQGLARVPREAEWFKNIRNPSTKRAYENAIRDFMLFTGIKRPEEFRLVTRAHVIAWRDALGERTAPFWRPCSITRSGARSCANSPSGTQGMNAVECRI
jgi:integrase/recombinase XerD